MYFFFKLPSLTLISGEEPYHGCTDFLTVTIINIIIIIIIIIITIIIIIIIIKIFLN